MGRKTKSTGKSKQPSHFPQEKDDGTRWTIYDPATGHKLYLGTGITRAQAERLNAGLLRPGEMREVT